MSVFLIKRDLDDVKCRVNLQFANVSECGQYVYRNILKSLITCVDENQSFDKGKNWCFNFVGLERSVSLIFSNYNIGCKERRSTLQPNRDVQVFSYLC